MFRKFSVMFMALMFVAVAYGKSFASSDYMIYVVLDKSKQMALISPDTKTIVGYNQLPVLGTHGVTIAPDMKYLYINAMPPADIVEYDIAKKGVSKWFPIKETTKNCGIRVAPDGRHVISSSQNKKVIVLDRISGKYKVIKTPDESHQFTFAPDGKAWVAGGKGGKIWIIDWKKGKMVDSFKVGKVPHGIAFSPDKSKVLVSLRGENRIAIYDAKPPHKEVGSIPIKVSKGGLCNIALMPDNKSYWVAETFGRTLWQIDAENHDVIHHIEVDGEPHHALPVKMDGSQQGF